MGDSAAIPDMVRRCYDAYRTGDRSAIEPLLGPDFTFTSPYDDHIDRAAYFERCWPLAGSFAGHDLQRIMVDGDACFVLYEAATRAGATFRNTELFRFANGRIRSVEVFFGREPGAQAVAAEDEIRRLIAAQADGIRARDAQAVMAGCAADMLSFDVVPPLANRGAGAVRERLERWFAAYDGPIGTEHRDLHVEASGDVAFSHFLQRFTGTMTGGTAVDMWVRVTMGLRRIDGAWKIVHEHMSDPFDPETGQGRTDLQPAAAA